MVIGGTTERARNICSAWREEEEDALVVGRCDCDLYVCGLCYMVSINEAGCVRARARVRDANIYKWATQPLVPVRHNHHVCDE